MLQMSGSFVSVCELVSRECLQIGVIQIGKYYINAVLTSKDVPQNLTNFSTKPFDGVAKLPNRLSPYTPVISTVSFIFIH